MSHRTSMPRVVIAAAGWLILLAAVAGLALGIARSDKAAHGVDSETGEIVAPIKGAANAQAVTAPPVTEADVRRWAREELTSAAPKPVKKPKTEEDAGANGAAPAATTSTSTNTTTAASAATPAKPANATGNKTAPQIPF